LLHKLLDTALILKTINMSSPEPPRYRTTNWETYNAALRSRGIATIWFNRDMQCLAQPSGKTDRNPTFSDAAVRFCLTMKGLFGLPLRQATGFVHSLLQLSWLEWPVPDYSTLCHRQMLIKVVIPYRPQPAGLHLLIDSTGAKMLGQSEWARKKQGADYRRKSGGSACLDRNPESISEALPGII